MQTNNKQIHEMEKMGFLKKSQLTSLETQEKLKICEHLTYQKQQAKRPSPFSIERRNNPELEKEIELPDHLMMRKTQSEAKTILRSQSQKKIIEKKITSIQNKIEELKAILMKKKEKKNQRDALRHKIRQNRKLFQEEDDKRYESVDHRKNTSDSFLSNILTQDKVTKLQGLVTQVPKTRGSSIRFNPYTSQNNTYYISQVLKAFRDENSVVTEHILNTIEVFKSFQEIKMPNEKAITRRRLKLPRRPGYEYKKTIIFDLDETLIHCNETTEQPCDVILPIQFPNNEVIEAGINIRPGALTILRELSKQYELMVFTASHYCYGNVVIDYLDPTGEYIHHRLFRQHCHFIPPYGPYVKDLRIIDRDPSQMVLVDNAAYSYVFQKDNGIPILPYYSGSDDFELMALLKFLKGTNDIEDERVRNRQIFKLEKYNPYSSCIELVEGLYAAQ